MGGACEAFPHCYVSAARLLTCASLSSCLSVLSHTHYLLYWSCQRALYTLTHYPWFCVCKCVRINAYANQTLKQHFILSLLRHHFCSINRWFKVKKKKMCGPSALMMYEFLSGAESLETKKKKKRKTFAVL